MSTGSLGGQSAEGRFRLREAALPDRTDARRGVNDVNEILTGTLDINPARLRWALVGDIS